MSNSTVSGNTSAHDGGGLFSGGSMATLTNVSKASVNQTLMDFAQEVQEHKYQPESHWIAEEKLRILEEARLADQGLS